MVEIVTLNALNPAVVVLLILRFKDITSIDTKFKM